MARGLLFDVQNPYDKATNAMGGASQSYASMQRGGETKTEPIKSIGGGIGAAATGLTTAAAVGTGLSTIGATAAAGAVGGPVGLAIGTVLGLASYLFG
jgi:hypothetical protein